MILTGIIEEIIIEKENKKSEKEEKTPIYEGKGTSKFLEEKIKDILNEEEAKINVAQKISVSELTTRIGVKHSFEEL